MADNAVGDTSSAAIGVDCTGGALAGLASIAHGASCHGLSAAHEIGRLKELRRSGGVSLRAEQAGLERAEAGLWRAEEEASRLRAEVAQLRSGADRQACVVREECRRFDAEADEAAAGRAEAEALRLEAADLLAAIRTVPSSTTMRVQEAVAALEAESAAREGAAAAERQCEREAIDRYRLLAEARLAELHDATESSRVLERRVRRRIAVARLGRAASAWRHQRSVAEMRDRARRSHAAEVRRLSREDEEAEGELQRRRASLREDLRKQALVDAKAREDRAAVLDDLRSQVSLLRERLAAAEERTRQRAVLAEIVVVERLSESEKARRRAEALSGAGNAAFAQAARRLGQASQSDTILGQGAVAGQLRHLEEQIRALPCR